MQVNRNVRCDYEPMTRRVRWFILSAAYLFGILYPQGGPPMITDDPGTPEKGGWEINVSFNTDLHQNEKEFEAPLMDINYGWNDHTQLKVEFPYLATSSGNKDIHHKFGDISIGLKYRFLDEDQVGFSLSAFPQIELESKRHPENEYLLPVEIEKEFAGLVLGLDFRTVFIPGNRIVFQNGIVTGYSLNERITVMGEWTHEAEKNLFAEGNNLLNGGIKVIIKPNLVFMASFGTNFPSSENKLGETIFSYTGLQFLF